MFPAADARETQARYLAVTAEKHQLPCLDVSRLSEEGTDFDKVAERCLCCLKMQRTDTILIATGSEGEFGGRSYPVASPRGKSVISMPSQRDVFDAQDAATRRKSFQMQFNNVFKVEIGATETGTNMLVFDGARFLGIDTF